jgi:hypothetical protein
MRAMVAVACVLVSACSAEAGMPSTLAVGRDDLQHDIAQRLTEAGEQPESVTCKEDLVGEVGKTAHCEVVMSPTNSFEPVITVTAVEGTTIDYEMSPAVSKEQLEKAVSRLVGSAAGVPVDAVTCESGLTGNVGALAYCDVQAAGVKLRRTIEVNRVEGLMMNFDVVPVLTEEEVADSLLDELQLQDGQRPDGAECSGNLEGKPGNAVDCTVRTGQDIETFTLTVTTIDDGKIKYNFRPKA